MLLLLPRRAAGLQELLRGGSRAAVLVAATILSIISAPSSAQHVEFVRRVASFLGSQLGAAGDDVAERLADSGFFLDADGQLVCFCCGFVDSAGVQLHSCAYQQLLSVLDDGADGERRGWTKPWPARQVNILLQFLKSPVPALVESFGFPRCLVTFAAVKQFSRNSWRLPDSPGELMQLTQNLVESPLVSFANRVDMELLVAHLVPGGSLGILDSAAPMMQLDGASAETRPISGLARATAHRSASVSTAAAAAAEVELASSTLLDDSVARRDSMDSGMCVICLSRQRSQVTLPCSHFVACAQCLQSSDRCPVCHGRIFATIVAYIC